MADGESPSSACRHRPGSSHGSRPVLRTPLAGRRGLAATPPFLTKVARGTSPRPVFTGRGLG
ncbi:hypothetical protein E0H54_23335 [Rhizobium leguminosarum bv. viciae]|nr:hypothetical protein E0H54_23335 [Rhizobium leguminosarum bv. viciae]